MTFEPFSEAAQLLSESGENNVMWEEGTDAAAGGGGGGGDSMVDGGATGASEHGEYQDDSDDGEDSDDGDGPAAMVTRIQSRARGMQARLLLKTQRNAARKMQSQVRGMTQRKRFSTLKPKLKFRKAKRIILRQRNAATKLQSAWRGKLQRRFVAVALAAKRRAGEHVRAAVLKRKPPVHKYVP